VAPAGAADAEAAPAGEADAAAGPSSGRKKGDGRHVVDEGVKAAVIAARARGEVSLGCGRCRYRSGTGCVDCRHKALAQMVSGRLLQGLLGLRLGAAARGWDCLLASLSSSSFWQVLALHPCKFLHQLWTPLACLLACCRSRRGWTRRSGRWAAMSASAQSRAAASAGPAPSLRPLPRRRRSPQSSARLLLPPQPRPLLPRQLQ
jgi:hypothetical protein